MRRAPNHALLAVVLALCLSRAGGQPTTAPAAPPAVPSQAQRTTTAPAERADGRASQRPLAATTAPAAHRVVIIPLNGVIDDYTRDALFRRMDEARKLGADAVIVKLNTPGGVVSSAMEISRRFKQTQDLRIIAFVEQRAYSAGTLIAVAAHEIVMEPHAMIGDVAPIAMSEGGGLQTLGDAERAKAASPIVADFRESARMRGYDPLLVEAMVIPGRVVYWIENDQGRRQFVDSEDYKSLTAAGGWHAVMDVTNPIDKADELLTVDSEVAVKLGLASEIVSSPQALAEERGYSILTTLEPTIGDEIIGFLGSMAVRAILSTVFMLSIYMAFSHPGHGMAEVVAVVSLGVLLGVPWLTGYAQWWEILAVLVGLTLLALEIFVIPGFGVAGVAGILLFVFGLLMTFVPKEPGGLPGILPNLAATWRALINGLIVVIGSMASSLFLWFWLNRYLPRLPYFNRLILTTTSGGGALALDLPADAAADGTAGPADAPSVWPAVGTCGVALTDLRPGGSAAFLDPALGDSRVVDVVSDSGFLPANAPVTVREHHGSYVIVRAAPRAASAQAGPAGAAGATKGSVA